MSKTSVCIQAGTILLIILRKRAVSAFYAGWVSAKHPSAFPSQKLMQYFIIAYRSIKSMMSPYKAPFLVQSCRWNFCGSHFGAQGILFPRSPQELTKGGSLHLVLAASSLQSRLFDPARVRRERWGILARDTLPSTAEVGTVCQDILSSSLPLMASQLRSNREPRCSRLPSVESSS